MDIKVIPRLGTCFILLLSAAFAHAEPVLNGLAVSVELNKERFIAGLYTSNPSTNATDLLTNSGERRMEIKVTARRFSARSLNNMWIEGMAINNPSSALRAESENLSKMVNMIRKSLTEGDTLTFDTAPGEGTRVTLNGVQLGTINSEDFFTLLLRTWIGNVPLSSDFKAGLLAGGEYDQDLRDRFSRIEPTPVRIATVEGWVVPAPPSPAETPTTTAAITPPRPQVQIDVPRPRIQPPASQTIEALRQQPSEQVAESLPANRPTESNPDGAAETENEVASTPADSAPANNPPANEEAPAQPTQLAVAEPITPAVPTEPLPLEEEDEEEEAVITAESLLERQFYISDVLRQARRTVKYPDRALRREQEGTVLVSVTLDRTGKLLGTLTVEESRYSILNREAEESIERAAPYKPFPDSITDETYSFAIPITFTIAR